MMLLKKQVSSSLKRGVAATDVQTAGTKAAGKESDRMSVTRGIKGKKQARMKKSDNSDVRKESNKVKDDQECMLSILLCYHSVMRVTWTVAA